jgi:hypothetical protein
MTNRNEFPEQVDRPSSDYNAVTNDGTVNTRPATQDEVAYRNGYVQGRNREQIYNDVQRTRESNSAATGTVVGVLLAAVVGLILAMVYILPQMNRTETTPSPTASPAQPQSNKNQPKNTEKTTVIERRVQEVIPVPQPQRTEIIVPSTQPQTNPNPSSSSSSSSPSQSDAQGSDSAAPSQTSSQTAPQTSSQSGTADGTGAAAQ